MASAGEDTNLVSHEDGSKPTNSKGKNKSKLYGLGKPKIQLNSYKSVT